MLLASAVLVALAPAAKAAPPRFPAPRVVNHTIASRALGARRNISVLLPPEYALDPSRRFPVLYLQDGQNLGPHGWNVCSGAECARRTHGAAPVIIVAIPHAGTRRIFEYSPSRDGSVGDGGGADGYVRFVADEVKPWVDRAFRTRPEARHTGIGGSSLGGLVALHAALGRPEVFGRIMAMSPSLWWNSREMITRFERAPSLSGQRIYLDSGGSGPSREGCEDVFRLRDVLASKRLRFGHELWHWFEARHTHTESAWRERFPRALGALFPIESDQ